MIILAIHYTGEFDPQKDEQIMNAAGPSTFESTYTPATQVRRFAFRCADSSVADAMLARINGTGLELSKAGVE